MPILTLLFALILLINGAARAQHDPANSFRVLCYHDVRDRLKETFALRPDPSAVDTDELIAHFAWLREHGYQPVSLSAIVASRNGGPPLPPKAILLTFDDGYKSTYSRVFPLLKLFRYPALIALVGDWLRVEDDGMVDYDGNALPRNHFITWQEVREMVDSGLVEVASHSHHLHRGLLGNPQGNRQPAAITREYYREPQRYEDDAQYTQRLRDDLARSTKLIERHTGQRPRAMVWPYGAYNRIGLAIAKELGMPITLNLEPGPNVTEHPLTQIRRVLMEFHHSIGDLPALLQQSAHYGGEYPPLKRIVHVDLDYVYDPDPERQADNLSMLVERIHQLRINTVYLQAFADPDGDGAADALYFPNRHLPMRADLFNRVAWQLRTRGGVKVYAWMPLLAFHLPKEHAAAKLVVQVESDAPPEARQNRYHRLSPFVPLVRQTITEIYQDLAKHAHFAGLLFHDDATLSDYEDASPAARKVYQQEWQLPDSITAIRADANLRKLWSQRKSDYLNRFSLELAAAVKHYHPALLTARNLYARTVLEPESEEWLGQSLSAFLRDYDFTAVMAMPYLENAADPEAWLKQLVTRIATLPDALPRTVFELQSRDWRNNTLIPSEVLARHLLLIQLHGGRNFGYYPDDFSRNHPAYREVRRALSLETNPVKR